MCIHRFFKRQLPPKSGIREVVFLLFIVLLAACGGDESVNNPVGETVAHENIDRATVNYYPMTIGSRWVYRNPDNSEWAREVITAEISGSNRSHFFRYDFTFTDNRLGFLKTPVYVKSPNRLNLRAADADISEINDVLWQTILQSRDNRECHHGAFNGWQLGHRFSNGVWQTSKYSTDKTLVYLYSYETRIDRHSEFNLLDFPVNPGYIFEALRITFTGSHRLKGDKHVSSMIHSYEANVTIVGVAGYLSTVVTPAGAFQNCLEIEYEVAQLSVNTKALGMASNPNGTIPETSIPEPGQLLKVLEEKIHEELKELFKTLVPILGFETVWLAPGVGPVKIETSNGIAELISYEIKPVASNEK